MTRPAPPETLPPLDRLLEIMARLRDPNDGCPWDQEQTFATVAPYTVEEAYEVADAIERGDLSDLKEELGDLLLQVVFHARMAEEQNAFSFADVVEAITTKMVRRHPHVFADAEFDRERLRRADGPPVAGGDFDAHTDSAGVGAIADELKFQLSIGVAAIVAEQLQPVPRDAEQQVRIAVIV